MSNLPASAVRNWRLAVDIGGTFTDIVLLEEASGLLHVGKTLTTPDDPSRGVINGVSELIVRHDIQPNQLANCVHGTTLVTNALIERKGAKTGLVTTLGFRDVLEIGRELRYDLYDLRITIPSPLVPRHFRCEVAERTGPDGAVVDAVDLSGVRMAVNEMVAAGIESLAIVFLHAYRNSHNELGAERAVREGFPGLFISCSHQVAREVREFERTSTTVANAYVQPLAARYIARLETDLKALGLRGQLALMVSAGGLTSARSAAELPVQLVESGPAAGAIAGAFYGQLADEPNVLAFDMGGTTAKACIVDSGAPNVAYTFEAGRIHRFKKGSGLPLKIPTIDLIEIGAGGGSIARIDRLGLLQVGPDSAGASPGPACYGLGGKDPTVTDADLVLGYLRPDYFLGGLMLLNPDAARSALAQLGTAFGKGIEEIAWGVHAVVTESMAAAARVHIAERGRDPRNYTLIATGGAGPVHAYELARKLQLRRILCPLASGVASTIGLLVATPRIDLVEALISDLAVLDWTAVNRIFERMTNDAAALLARLGVPATVVEYRAAADLRYVGQGFEVLTELPPGPYSAQSQQEVVSCFEAAYRRLYGRTVEGLRVEAVNWRLRAFGTSSGAPAIKAGLRSRKSTRVALRSRVGRRQAYFPEGGWITTDVYDRYRLTPGDRFSGPAIIEEAESTAVVGPRGRFNIDENYTLIIERDPD